MAREYTGNYNVPPDIYRYSLANGPGSQAKKYVNVAGGRAKSEDVARALETVNAFLHHMLPVKEG